VDVEKYASYVNKLHQNVGLETWLWRHKQRTPNTNDHHMPLNETPMKIFCVRPGPYHRFDEKTQERGNAQPQQIMEEVLAGKRKQHYCNPLMQSLRSLG